MPMDETIATFGYLLKEINELGLAYVCLTRYHPMFDITLDGMLLPLLSSVITKYQLIYTS